MGKSRARRKAKAVAKTPLKAETPSENREDEVRSPTIVRRRPATRSTGNQALSPIPVATNNIAETTPTASPLPQPSAEKMQKTPQLFQTTHISPVKKQQPYLTSSSRPDTPEDGSIKVFIRLRPSSPQQQTGEGEQCVKLEDTNDANTTSHSLTLLSCSEPTTYIYDHIAPPDTTQDQVFKAVGRPMVDHVLAGFNASILCYGQTCSGKTYTMLGELPATTGLHRDGYKSISHMPENAGLIPRIVHHLFEKLKKEQQEAEDRARGGGGDGDTSASNQVTYTVKCAMLEIYKEEISDLLASHAVHGTTPGPTATGTAAGSTTTNKLLIREDAKGVVVDGLTWTNVTSEEAALKVLTRGAAARRVAETRANARSSRSHCVFSCWLESHSSSCSSPTSPEAAAAGGGLSNNKNTVVRTAMLHMVDLAGSERQSTAGTEGERLKEAAAINKSLLTLGLVINKLADTAGGSTGGDESSSAHVHQQQQHIPYRSSKLTHLLKESLGGNARSIVIATISPSSACASETASTLAFAARAGRVKNKPKINENVTVNAAVLARDNKRLKAELAAAMTMNTEKAASRAAYAELEAARDQNNALEYSVAELKERLASAEAGRAVMENEIAALKAQMVEANDARLEATAAKSDALERCNDLEMMEQMLKSQLETLQEEKYELDQAHREVINTLGRYKGDKESLMEQLEEMTAEKQQLAATLAATRENQAGVAAETDKQRAEVAILRAELAGVRAELSLKQDANAKLANKLLQHESDSTSSFVVVAGDTSPAPSKNSSKAIQTSNSAPPKAKREIDNAAVTSSPNSNNSTEQLKETALKLEAKLYGSEKLQKELEQQCATLTVERDAATQRVSDLEAQLVESQQYADGLMGDAADAAQRATAAIYELDMLKANFAVEKEAALSSLNDKLTRTKEELVRVHLNSQRSIDAADERIAALKAELATALCRKQVNNSSSAAGVVADVQGKSDTNASMNSSKAGMKILKTELEAQKEAVLKMEALLAHRERKLEIATSQWSKAKEEISTLTKRLHASQDEAAEFETELGQIQQQLSVVEKEKAELKAANDAAGDDEKKEEEAMAAAATKYMEEIEKLSTALVAAKERAVQAEQEVADLAAKVDDLEQGLEVRTQQLNAHETAVSELETRLELAQSNNAACTKELEMQVSHLKRIVEERAAAVKAGELRAARLEDELTAAKSQLAAHKDLAEQRDQACLDLENDLSSMERQHEALKQTASQAELSLDDMTAKVAVCESKIKDLESDMESKEWRVNDLQAQVVDLKEALFSSTSDLQAAQHCVEELSTDVEARDWRIKDLSTQLANLKCAVNTMEGIKMEMEAHTAELEKEVREYQATVQHLKEQLSLVAEGTQRDADEGQAALLALKDRVKSLSEHAARRDAEVEQLKVTMRKNIAQELDAARQAHSAALEEAVKTHAEAEAAATAKVHRLKSAAEQAKKTVETLKVQLEEAELARRYAMQQSAHQLKEVDAKRAAAEVAGATQAANLQRQLAVLSSKHKKAAAERDAVTDALKALKDAFQNSEHRHKEGRKMLEQKVDALRKEVELTREALMVAEAAQLTGGRLTERGEELEEEEQGTPEAASPQKNMGKIALGGGMLRPLVLNDNNDDDDELEEKTPEGRNIEGENSENSGPVQLPLNTPIGWGFAYQRRYLDENTPPPGGMSPSKKRILEARGPLAARSQQVAMMNIMGNE